jgi:serine/threonine protein kinase/tetratricopeptide (TPR) repeat protein
MKIPIATFVEALLESRVLDPAQQEAFSRGGLARLGDPGALADELLRRGWLTRFQLAEIERGRGKGLVRGPYLLLEGLGGGGMGRVFKARHRRMKRVVALKFIHRHLLTRPDAVQRFYREVEAVARLSHPNIAMAFDAGEVDGTHYLVTEYVDGVDLRTLLQRDGPLPVSRACEAARQAALGLQHASLRGLVHRDIKPANLLISREGVVKIVDLGLARLAVADLEGPEDAKLTRTGELMGTPDYLAPEQILDFHRADIRADIYSLGCTLYQLLTGQPPFAGHSLAMKLLVQRRGDPPDVTTRRSDLPPGLAAVIHTMMARRPEHRYQTPAEVAAALEPFARTVAAGRPAVRQAPPPEPARTRDESDSRALLEKYQTWVPGGGFSRPEVNPEAERLAPRAPLVHRPGVSRDVGGLPKRLALVAGTIALALVGLWIWVLREGRGTGQATSIVKVREPRKPGISRPASDSHVETAHIAPPRAESEPIATKGRVVPSDPGSARAYLDRARARLAARDFAGAVAAASDAIRLEPRLAEAYILRAWAYNDLNQVDRAIADATEALRLDPASSQAYTQRALAHNNAGKPDRALADSTEALRLDPKSVLAYTQRARVYLHRGDPDRAIADYSEAVRLDPRLAWIVEHRARAYIMKGEQERVIEDCTEAVRLDPNLAFAYFERGDAYARLGEFTRALADADEAIRLEPQLAGAHRLRGDVCMKVGNLDRAIAGYTEAIRLDPRSVASYRSRAAAYGRQGELDRAESDRREVVRLEASRAK